MRRTYEHGTKARLNFSGEPHAPVNMADSREKVNEDGSKWHSRNVCSAVLRYISYATFRKSLKFFGTSIVSLDPKAVELPAFIRHLSLALVPRSNVLRMNVKLAY